IFDEREAWHRKLYEAGYVGMLWPREYGGWGATPMQQAIVQDEMARVSAPPAINGLGIGFIVPAIIVHRTEEQMQSARDERPRARSPPAINGLGIGFIGPTIIVHGTEAQKKRYLKKMLTAEEIWCQLYSEPNTGSALDSPP